MNVYECLQMLRKMKDVAFASVDEYGLPQVRIIDIMHIEKDRLYFCCAWGKDFYKQITENENIAVVGMNQKYQMVRVNGKVEKLKDQKKWIDLIFEQNPSMKQVYPNHSRSILEAFVIKDASIEFFDLSVQPVFRAYFKIGEYQINKKGFRINEKCIQCGLCARECPQQCILKKETFMIEQSHCLHCGLCFEVCPVNAIERM